MRFISYGGSYDLEVNALLFIQCFPQSDGKRMPTNSVMWEILQLCFCEVFCLYCALSSNLIKSYQVLSFYCKKTQASAAACFSRTNKNNEDSVCCKGVCTFSLKSYNSHCGPFSSNPWVLYLQHSDTDFRCEETNEVQSCTHPY